MLLTLIYYCFTNSLEPNHINFIILQYLQYTCIVKYDYMIDVFFYRIITVFYFKYYMIPNTCNVIYLNQEGYGKLIIKT